MKTRMNSLLGRGPNRSDATRIHGPVGNGFLSIAESLINWDTRRQSLHVLTNSSASLSIKGHHTLDLKRRFIVDSPWCPSCANSRTRLRRVVGIRMVFPLSRRGPTLDSSNRNGFNFVDVSRSRNDDSAISEIVIDLGIAIFTTRKMLYSFLLVAGIDDDWQSRDNTSDIFSFPAL